MTIREARRPLIRRRIPDTVGGMLGVGLLAGSANVIMQLSRPGVGYGVVESRVESGRIDRHPIKRARTTFTYLAVSVNGTREQQAAYRRAVNGAHAQVYSTEESPVSYNAFDPELQMWVGACMYKGVADIYRIFVGEIDDKTAEQLFEEGIALGTMLQVPRETWPPTRRRSIATGMSRWPRFTSTTKSVTSSGRSPRGGCVESSCLRLCSAGWTTSTC